MIVWLLDRGPIITLLASLLVSPAGMICISIVIERRIWRRQEQYLAFLYGDLGLAISIAVGAVLWPEVSQNVRLTAGWLQWFLLGLGLVVGVCQARAEYKRGVYSRAEVLSPSKLWHQGLIVPLLTAGVGLSMLTAIAEVRWHPGLSCVVAAGVLFWMTMMLYDRGHPKSAHSEFDWSHAKRKTK